MKIHKLKEGNLEEFKRFIGCFVLIVFLLLLVPLLWIGQYNHPSADDFSFGLHTAQIWAETHSALQTLQAAVEQVGYVYTTWQGTFSAVFLMALQPAVFGEAMYIWTPFLLLFSLIIGTALFFKVVLMNYFKADIWDWIIFSGVILIAMIQFVYSPVEGFYWYNGGIYYTFFYSLSLCFFSCILLYLKSKNRVRKVIFTGLSAALGVFLGGGNYTTALNIVIVVTLLVGYLVAQKDKRAVIVGAILLFCLISFAISMLAPGNAVRQDTIGQPNAIKAIVLSFLFGGYSIFHFATLPVVLIWIFLLPYMYRFVKRTNFSFRYPFLVLFLSFCVYCAQVTPPFYAMGLSLPERLINIVYYSFHIFSMLNLLYIVGWLSKQWEKHKKNQKEAVMDWIKAVKNKGLRYSVPCTVALILFIVCSSIGLCTVEKGDSGAVEFHRLPTSASAGVSLLTGEAQKYHKEVEQRIAVYQNSSEKDIVVKEYSVKPWLLYYTDITHNPTDWRNTVVADFYKKESVKLQDERNGA